MPMVNLLMMLKAKRCLKLPNDTATTEIYTLSLHDVFDLGGRRIIKFYDRNNAVFDGAVCGVGGGLRLFKGSVGGGAHASGKAVLQRVNACLLTSRRFVPPLKQFDWRRKFYDIIRISLRHGLPHRCELGPRRS